VLEAAGALIDVGVPYTELTDRLQWRHPDYFKMLGEVMGTVEFHLDGRLVTARLTRAMRERIGESDDDSDDFVGLIRYAEGTLVAALLKERDDGVKLSVRSRGGVSAQSICRELGGGGHLAAAGATVGRHGRGVAATRGRHAPRARAAGIGRPRLSSRFRPPPTPGGRSRRARGLSPAPGRPRR